MNFWFLIAGLICLFTSARFLLYVTTEQRQKHRTAFWVNLLTACVLFVAGSLLDADMLGVSFWPFGPR